MRAALLLLAVAFNTFAAGPIILGVRGGVPFTDTSSTGGVGGAIGALSSSQRFKIGPTVGVRLPLGFSVEGDALLNRQTLDFAGFGIPGTTQKSWEFPVMLKFAVGHQAVAPVLGAGVTVRHITDFGSIPGFLTTGSTSPNTVGFVAGGGVRFRLGPVDVTPELRYTRWGGNTFTQSLTSLLPFNFNRNEASVLVGITF